jgi:polyhydroxyalkanoate synthesis repressor PhaR
MAKTQDTTVIKKYANRRLYNTGTSTYVTLEDLATMVKNQEDFVVYDAKSGEEITRSVLTQIIFEQESKGTNLLPVAFLRQLIGFYGDSMQSIVPSYLEHSMASFTKDQEKIRQSFGAGSFESIEDQVRRNTEMFENAIRMFSPFTGDTQQATDDQATDDPPTPAAESDIDALREQMAQMQKKLDSLADNKR